MAPLVVTSVSALLILNEPPICPLMLLMLMDSATSRSILMGAIVVAMSTWLIMKASMLGAVSENRSTCTDSFRIRAVLFGRSTWMVNSKSESG